MIEWIRTNHPECNNALASDVYWSAHAPTPIVDEAASYLSTRPQAYIKVIEHSVCYGDEEPMMNSIEIWENGECIYSRRQERET